MNKIYKVIWSKARECYVAVSEIAKSKGKGGALLSGVVGLMLPLQVAMAAPVMPTLDYRGAPGHVTIASSSNSTTATMNISSTQANNVLKWIDFSIGHGGTVQFDGRNYLNYVTGHGRSEIDGILKGTGNIFLINPNGIIFGANAQVDVGNLYLSTRSLDQSVLDAFANNGTNPLTTSVNAVTGDIINMGTLKATNITVEGNNITFKNVAEVTPSTAINVRASGEVHVGYEASGVVNEVNTTEYKSENVAAPDLGKWNFKGLDNTTAVTPLQYMLVRNVYELQNMQNNLSGNYMLANDIDAGGFEGFVPVGNNSTRFNGRFDGIGLTIRNLNIISGTSNVGLFGYNEGTIENVGLENGSVTGTNWYVGSISGRSSGTIRNVYNTGTISGGGAQIGGIVGRQESTGLIQNAYNTGTIKCKNTGQAASIGGIAGEGIGKIQNVYNTGQIIPDTSLNDAAVMGYCGGIVGKAGNLEISNAYNTGAISGRDVAGIVGGTFTSANVTIDQTYNTGKLTARNRNDGSAGSAGGIFGTNGGSATIKVTKSFYYYDVNMYGVVGDNGTLPNGYGTPKTSGELNSIDTYAGWDISSEGGSGKAWRIYKKQTGGDTFGYRMPILTAFLKTKDVVKVFEYDGAAHGIGKGISVYNSYLDNDRHIFIGPVCRVDTDTNINAGVYEFSEWNKRLFCSDQAGYDIVDMKYIIQPKKVSATFDSDVYNGTNTFAGVSGTLSNVVASDVDNLTVTVTATYADKNVGINKDVTYSNVTLAGTAKNNYIIADTIATKGTITPAPLTLTAADVTKTYDGTTVVANGVLQIESGTLYAGDSISGGTFAFADKNAGANKTVTVAGATISDGNSGGNYNVSYANNTTSTINKADLTLTAADVTKTYDGTTVVANGVLQVKSGTLYDDDSISGGTFAFADKNAGTNKTVTVAGATINDGNSGGNYNVSYANNTTSTINKADLTLTAADVTKTYDGTTDVTDGELQVKSGTLYGTDSISGGTFAFADKNAGTNKTVTVAGATINDGNNGSNYNVSYADNTTSTINKADLTLTAADVTKTYDGTTVVADGVLQVISGTLYDDDSISGGTFAFADKNAGTNKTVTVEGATVNDGNSGGNYNVSYASNTTSTINKADLTLTAADVTKTYDGTTAVTGGVLQVKTGTLYEGDSISGGTFAFADKNAGANKTVTVDGATISDGNNGGNYNVSYASNTTSTINKADLTLTAADVTKTYDGTTAVTGGVLQVKTGTLYEGDSISGGTFAFADKNAGANKTVMVDGATISDGNNGGNYNVSYASNTTSTINKADLTLTAADVTKTYDGTTVVADGVLQVKSGTLYAGDSISGGTFAFADKNAGTNKTVTVAGATVNDGNSGGNYNVSYVSNTTSTINKADLTLTAADVTKEYDGTTTVTNGELQVKAGTVFAGDSVSGGTFSFADKNAGANKTVTVDGATISDGNNGGNYNVTYADNTTSTITRKALVLVADAASIQEGDAKPTALTGTVTGFVPGENIGGSDNLLFTLSEPSATAVGSYGIAGSINGSTSGEYGLNYTFSNDAANATAFTITPKPVVSKGDPVAMWLASVNLRLKDILGAIQQGAENKNGAEAVIANEQRATGGREQLSVEGAGVNLPGTMAAYKVMEKMQAEQNNKKKKQSRKKA
ncbi:YDG domain-containing protein [Selenomonas ruminantium]|uniref:YDG domain-containing protein n=1 Tax=Selenomonas ruminantium TaxID=971 RepID=UPI0018AF73DD|nr:YDG domain-containing protein [Selenomonas ruminantium]